MGSACCVAARDRTITSRTREEIFQRNVRYSPSWSFRWDNRRRVAGEEIPENWTFDGGIQNDRMEIKSQSLVATSYASEEGSPLDSSRTLTWQKSQTSEINGENLRLPLSDQSNSRDSLTELKEPTETPAVSNPSPAKLPHSEHSISSLSTSPLSSQSQVLPASSTSTWRPHHSPGHQLSHQVSGRRIPRHKSRNFSVGGSSDFWSMPGFPEFMHSFHRERWSLDSEQLSFVDENVARSSSQFSASPFIDIKTCGVCSRLLTEKSSWGSQKIIATNELPVVAVLICGHVYHAECLENMTTEFNKYDPACPVCTFGEKQTQKLSERALRAEMDLKARNKRLRNQVVYSDLDGACIVSDGHKSDGFELKGLKNISSSSMKSSLVKPLLRRHFSFGSKGAKLLSENHPKQKKGFFWSKSMK